MDAPFLLKQDYVSKLDGKVFWYQEPLSEERDIKDTFRHKDCLHSGYNSTIIDQTLKFYLQI